MKLLQCYNENKFFSLADWSRDLLRDGIDNNNKCISPYQIDTRKSLKSLVYLHNVH